MRQILPKLIVTVGLLAHSSWAALGEESPQGTDRHDAASVTSESAIPETWTCFSTNGKTLVGIPAELRSIELVIYGDRVIVPLSVIRGIRFGTGLYDICTVKLMNGDTLNGAIDRHVFAIATDWGEVQVDRRRVQYLVRTAFARSAQTTDRLPRTIQITTTTPSANVDAVNTSDDMESSESLNSTDTWLGESEK